MDGIKWRILKDGWPILPFFSFQKNDSSQAKEKASFTYRVNLKIPWLSRLIEINDYFLIRQAKLLHNDMCTMCPRTSVVGVKLDLWRVSINVSHVEL